MQTDLELAWCKATPNERQAFVELFSDDIREMLPTYDDRDSGDDEFIGHHEQDAEDDEALDAPELPAVLDTNDSDDDDGVFPAADDEDFHAATRGIKRCASGKRVTAAPSKDDLQRMTQEFLSRGGQIAKIRPGISGLSPPPKRVPAWRRKIVLSKEA